jgi:thymidylate synthase (FAD)
MIAHAAMVSTKGILDEDRIAHEKVNGLLNYLMDNRHGTPFEHGSLTVRVHAPIKVWREWHRHRTGWSYSEESGRYKQLEALFYIPPRDRPMIRPEGFKSSRPAFDVATDEEYDYIISKMKEGYETVYRLYEDMLGMGTDRGLARDVLGVGTYSACYCTANPRSIMHFLELRTNKPYAKRPSKPLYEIAVAAEQLEKIFATYWPITWDAWTHHGRMAP